MPYEVPIPAIDTALREVMEADATLTGLIMTKPATRGGGPAIYADGEVPRGATMPYLVIGAWTQIGDHRLSPDGDASLGYGWNCTVMIKAVGQRSEMSLMAIMSRVLALFPHGKPLDVTGYEFAWTDGFTIEPTIRTTLDNTVTYEVPGILRVQAHD